MTYDGGDGGGECKAVEKRYLIVKLTLEDGEDDNNGDEEDDHLDDDD